MLFDPASDASRLAFTRIGDAGRRGLFRLALSGKTGRPIFHLALPVDSSGWSPPDYTASLYVGHRVRARGETIAGAEGLHLRLRGLGPRQTAHVTLMEDDGTSWTAAVSLDSTSVKVHPDGTGALKKTAHKPSVSPAADGTPRFIWLPRMLVRP